MEFDQLRKSFLSVYIRMSLLRKKLTKCKESGRVASLLFLNNNFYFVQRFWISLLFWLNGGQLKC